MVDITPTNYFFSTSTYNRSTSWKPHFTSVVHNPLSRTPFPMYELLLPSLSTSVYAHLYISFLTYLCMSQADLHLHTSLFSAYPQQNLTLKNRDVVRPLMHCKIGPGSSALLWHENWSSLGPLIDITGANGPRVTGIPRMAKVAQSIQGNNWILPRGRHPIIVLLKVCLPSVSLLTPFSADEFLWKNSASSDPSQFSSSLTWSALHPGNGLVEWCKVVWFHGNIPKYSFILWLVMRDRLTTRDRLICWGLQIPSGCLLCDDPMHLLFSSSYSSQIIRELFLHRSLVPPLCLRDMITWVKKATTSKRINICLLLLHVAVYEIWRNRNSQVHSSIVKPAETIIKDIRFILRKKLYGLDRVESAAIIPKSEPSFFLSGLSSLNFIIPFQG